MVTENAAMSSILFSSHPNHMSSKPKRTWHTSLALVGTVASRARHKIGTGLIAVIITSLLVLGSDMQWHQRASPEQTLAWKQLSAPSGERRVTFTKTSRQADASVLRGDKGADDRNRVVLAPDAEKDKARNCLQCDILDLRPSPSIGDASSIDASACADLPPSFGEATNMIKSVLGNGDRCIRQSCNIWVAYVGDSLLRSPYNHLVDLLLGREFGEGRNAFNLSTYHVDHRVCCRTQATLDKHQALDPNHCTFTRAFDTVDYVRDFLRETLRDPMPSVRNVCITWQWNRLADESLLNVLAKYTAVDAPSESRVESHVDDGRRETVPRPHEDAMLSPQIIIINPGLHVIMSEIPVESYIGDVRRLGGFMQTVSDAQQALGLVPTRLVFQEPTSMIDKDVKPSKLALVNQTMVARFHAKLEPYLDSVLGGTGTWLRVLPAFRLTGERAQESGLVAPLGDGVHYKGAYQSIVVRLHLYFMQPGAMQGFCKSHRP